MPFSTLPPELRYLAEFASRVGPLQTEGAAWDYLDGCTAAQRRELADLAARVLARNDYPRVCKWLDTHSIVEDEDAATLYFLFCALDAAPFKFD